LVLWDREEERVKQLTAIQSLELLSYLRTEEGWQEEGLVVGSPAKGLAIDAPRRAPEAVLVDAMELTAEIAERVLGLLEQSRGAGGVDEEAEKDQRRRLARAYVVLLELGEETGKKSRD